MSIKIISRGKGKSAVAAAAYRGGEKITNQYDGMIHDYTRKGGVVHRSILLPDHAPREFFDRSTLWNAVEKAEKNKNAQLAREIELALPKELSREENIALAREYCQQHFAAAGMCADICIHDTGGGNPHAHVMLTMRPIEQDGSWAAKSRKEYLLDENGERIRLKSGAFKSRKVDAMDWNDQAKAEQWREGWADLVNQYLERNSVGERVDHRSYARQGIQQIPTIHLGVAASQMERKGIATERGDLNRKIQLDNQQLLQLRARIRKLKVWLKDADSPSPGLVETLLEMLRTQEPQTRKQKIIDLKAIANAVAFLQSNNISDLAGLREKVSEIYSQLSSASSKLKKMERRQETLSKHIRQAEIYLQYKAVFRQYQQQKAGKREPFYEQHRAELALYETAEQYLHQVMNGRATLPIKAWKSEATTLSADRENLYLEYLQLKEDVRSVERIRRSIEQVMLDVPNAELNMEKAVEL